MLAVLGGKADDILHAHVIPRLDAESIIAFGETCTQIRTITLTDAVARLPVWKQIPFLTENFRTRLYPNPRSHQPSSISLTERFEWEDPRIGHMDIIWSPVPATDPPRYIKTINWPDDARITLKAQAIEVAKMVADYRQAMNTKIVEELSDAAGDAIAPGWDVSVSGYFQSMLENNDIMLDLTPEVMYRALERYIEDRYEWDGVYDMDVQPLLSGGFGAVSWSDTAVRDTIFEMLVSDLSY